MIKQIPNTAKQIQTGLWLNETPVVVLGQHKIRYELYSSEEYCFYDNTLSEEERIYWQYICMGFSNTSSDYTPTLITENIEVA